MHGKVATRGHLSRYIQFLLRLMQHQLVHGTQALGALVGSSCVSSLSLYLSPKVARLLLLLRCCVSQINESRQLLHSR
jgi:hypothetical protein